MSDSNMITAYSWATGLVQQDLPSSFSLLVSSFIFLAMSNL